MITIDQNKCTGCGNCINVCPFGAISIQNNKASINDAMCRLCGVCINECPEQAISEIQDAKQNAPFDSSNNNQQPFNPFSARGSGMGQGQGQGRGMGRGRSNNSGMGMGRGMGKGLGRKGKR